MYRRPIINGKLQCKKCLLWLPIESFSKRPDQPGHYKSYCKKCHSRISSTNTHKNMTEDKRKIRAEKAIHRRRKSSYGISKEDYEQLLATQNGVCAICGKAPKDKALSVDHNHKTGKVRGLLCMHCNTALGNFEDSSDLLVRAVEYLRRHDG